MEALIRNFIVVLIIGGLFNWLLNQPKRDFVKETYVIFCPIKVFVVFFLCSLFSMGISLYALYDYLKTYDFELLIIFVLFVILFLFLFVLLLFYKFKKIEVSKDNITIKRLFCKTFSCKFSDIVKVSNHIDNYKVVLKTGKSFKIDKVLVNSDWLYEKIK